MCKRVFVCVCVDDFVVVVVLCFNVRFLQVVKIFFFSDFFFGECFGVRHFS